MFAECQFVDAAPPVFRPVSFIIPAHNEQRYITKTIESISAAIDSLKLIAEVIVVNDDSTDETENIGKRLGTRVINVSLRNIGAVRNAGAKVASHPWLIFVDADTILPVETLRETLTFLAQGDAGGGARVELDQEKPIFFVKRIMFYCVVLAWHIIGRWAAGCYMYCRKDLFDSFGGFDENYFAAEELFFSRELKRRGRFRLVRKPVITSARKLRKYSSWQLMRFLLTPALQLRSMLRSRTGLEILYQDKR